MSFLEMTAKLLLAVALGGLIGLERETSQKPAGFRTNILICVSAAMMMILSDLLLQGTGAPGGDMTRIAAGVITGIGFIGAGTIIQARGSIVGLTTAATLWAVAGLGLVIGAGHYLAALIYTGVIILTLVIFRQVESKFLKKALYRYSIKTKTPNVLLIDLKKLAIHEGIKFKEISRRKEGDFSLLQVSFQAHEDKEQKFSLGLLGLEGVLEVKVD